MYRIYKEFRTADFSIQFPEEDTTLRYNIIDCDVSEWLFCLHRIKYQYCQDGYILCMHYWNVNGLQLVDIIM